jgi:hypothetical protein
MDYFMRCVTTNWVEIKELSIGKKLGITVNDVRFSI